MAILTRNIILLAIDAFGKKVEGKTMLQKRLYFLAELLKHRHSVDLGFRHNAYYYGPYSGTVSNDITKLKNYGLIREDVQNFGAYNAAGFEVRKSEYELTAAANAAIKWIVQHHPDEAKQVTEVARELNQLTVGLDYMDLSIAAKAHWILRDAKEPMTPESVAREAKKLSWNVTDEQIESGFKFLEKLGLVGQSVC
ncbi:MAG TPA: hypothetical protein VIS96_06865 [Terrimicrobiaceae bacterium]